MEVLVITINQREKKISNTISLQVKVHLNQQPPALMK